MVELSADSGIVHFMNGFECVLFYMYFTTLALTPLLIFILLIVFLATVGVFEMCLHKNGKVKAINKFAFWAIHFFFSHILDHDKQQLKFVLFGHIAPVGFSYLLLCTSILIIVNMFYRFCSVMLSSVEEQIPCDNSSSLNITDCVDLRVDINKGIIAATSLSVFISVVYGTTLKVLLHFSGGRKFFQSAKSDASCSNPSLWRVIITVCVQIFFISVAKLVFIAYWATTGFSPSLNQLTEANAYTVALVIDVICFGMLTPWCYFEVDDSKGEEQGTEMLVESGV